MHLHLVYNDTILGYNRIIYNNIIIGIGHSIQYTIIYIYSIYISTHIYDRYVYSVHGKHATCIVKR